MKKYSELDLKNDLKQIIGQAGSQAEVARRIGISRSYLNKVMHGEKSVAGQISKWLGYEVVTMFRVRSKP